MPKIESRDGVDIRCLSIKHPWASMIIDREKGIGTDHLRLSELGLFEYSNKGIEFLGMEIRTRNFPFRGLVLIRESYDPDLQACYRYKKNLKPQNPGMVIGWGRLVGVVPPIHQRDYRGRTLLEHYAKSRVEGDQKVYLIADPKRIEEPFPIRGLQNLYRVNQAQLCNISDPEILGEIHKIVREAARKRLMEAQRLRSKPTQPPLPL